MSHVLHHQAVHPDSNLTIGKPLQRTTTARPEHDLKHSESNYSTPQTKLRLERLKEQGWQAEDVKHTNLARPRSIFLRDSSRNYQGHLRTTSKLSAPPWRPLGATHYAMCTIRYENFREHVYLGYLFRCQSR